MSDAYYLPCNCGYDNIVSVSDAGKSIACESCSQTIEVPGMRDIKKLKPAAEKSVKAPEKKWTREKGIYFAFGMGAIVIGLAVFGACYYIGAYQFAAERPDVRGEWHETSVKTPPADYPVWGFAPEPEMGAPQYELSIYDPENEVWTFEQNRKNPVPKEYFAKWGDSYRASIESSVQRSTMKDLWKFWYETEPKEPLQEWQEPMYVINGRFAYTFYSFAAAGGVVALIGFGLVGIAFTKK